ncbi:MAG: hypothetical protein R3B95_11610 [Nitrospirales bacterium]|nr:hypothetical protein [Nitrospirales bacterium]
MYYIPLLIICSLNPGFVGDPDTGATCRKFHDLNDQVGYRTLSGCERRVKDMQDEILLDRDKLSRILPGPYRLKGYCVMETLSEVVL